jgi:sucrose-6F-phosphate phosphohydrolase
MGRQGEGSVEDRRILATDIDGTLLRDDEPTPGLETLRHMLRHTPRDVRLVYASGRSFSQTHTLVEQEILPPADAVAAFVGTEVWLPPWDEPDSQYHDLLGRSWDREAVTAVVQGFEGVEPQPDEFQTDLKASFFCEDQSVVQRLRDALDEQGLRARIIWSAGRHLDLLPRAAGKLQAVEFLRRRWQVPRERVLVCGDSGNDRRMLAEPGYLSVVVGNAEPELEDLPDGETFHQADLPYAAGVLEGAEAFGFWSEDGPDTSGGES